MTLPISVIIPTMNRPESLDRTLKCIAEAADVPQQIVVVDQSQNEETQELNKAVLAKYNKFESQVYDYQQTPSLTKARNLGLSLATKEILVFSDDDVDTPAFIFSNIASLMQDEKVAMIAGLDDLTQQSKTNIGYFLGTKSYVNRKIGHVTSSMLSRYPDNVTSQIETQWAQGYFFVVRKSCLNRWQIRWDENLTSYAYAEDLDFSYAYYKQAKKEGLRCILDPNVHVKHLATLEYREPSAKSTYMYIVNRKYLAHKHRMGFIGVLSRNWCEFWRFVERVVGRKEPKTFLKAYLCKFKYGKEINAGNLDYEKFMR